VASTVRGALSSRAGSLAACAALAAAAPGVGGCGEAQRDAAEVTGAYPVEVVRARFPRRQAVAHDTQLELVVRNSGSRTIPDVAVTLDSFYYTSDYPQLSVNKRPIWIVDNGPGAVAHPPIETEQVNPVGGASTAFVNTWALGALAPKRTARFLWRVTPVKSGRHVVYYAVAAGVDGKARARLAGGGRPVGRLVAQVAPAPPNTHVNPETGLIAPGANPVSGVPVGAVP
jgi:hypothetical protein